MTTLAPADTSEFIGEIETFENYSKKCLAACGYFTVYEYKLNGNMEYTHVGDSFQCVLVTQGKLDIKSDGQIISLNAGEMAFIPASCLKCDIDGDATFIISYK